MKDARSMKLNVISGFYFFLSVFLLTFSGCENRPPSKEEVQVVKIAEVEVMSIKPQSWTETISSYGVVEAAEEAFDEGADHVAFAGDIADAAQTELVASLVRRLQRLGLGPADVSLVPGNHDVFALGKPLTLEKVWSYAVLRDS